MAGAHAFINISHALNQFREKDPILVPNHSILILLQKKKDYPFCVNIVTSTSVGKVMKQVKLKKLFQKIGYYFKKNLKKAKF